MTMIVMITRDGKRERRGRERTREQENERANGREIASDMRVVCERSCGREGLSALGPAASWRSGRRRRRGSAGAAGVFHCFLVVCYFFSSSCLFLFDSVHFFRLFLFSFFSFHLFLLYLLRYFIHNINIFFPPLATSSRFSFPDHLPFSLLFWSSFLVSPLLITSFSPLLLSSLLDFPIGHLSLSFFGSFPFFCSFF